MNLRIRFNSEQDVVLIDALINGVWFVRSVENASNQPNLNAEITKFKEAVLNK